MGRPARSAESALFEQAYSSQPFTQVRVGHSLTAAYAEQDGFSRGSGPGPRRRKEVRDRQPLSAAVDTRPSPWTACVDSRLSTDFVRMVRIAPRSPRRVPQLQAPTWKEPGLSSWV